MQKDNRDFREEPIEWQELKDFVVDQVRRAGQRIDTSYVKEVIRERGGNVDKVLDRLAEKGFLTPAAPGAPRPPAPPSNRQDTPPSRRRRLFGYFNDYRRKLIKRAGRGLTGFRVHATAFAGVNIFLFVLWILTGAGHPWFLYPLGAWGIGLLSHLNPVVQHLRQRREVEALPDLNQQETNYVRRMHRNRTGFAAHLISTSALSAYLMMINVITPGGFLWSFIPASILAFGVVLHWSAYAPHSRKMKREIRGWIGGAPSGALGVELHAARAVEERGDTEEPAIVHQAAALRRTILKQIEEMEKDHPAIGGEMRPLLDTYFEQVSQLARKSFDIDSLLTGIPKSDLEQDRARLKNRMESVESDRLRKEYEKSILQVDKQLASIKELSHHSEMLDLRLTSAINLMKQLQLDLARVKGASLTNTSSVGMLKDKSDELSEYLKDLESGYNDLESDL
jgi:hypothetical protein